MTKRNNGRLGKGFQTTIHQLTQKTAIKRPNAHREDYESIEMRSMVVDSFESTQSLIDTGLSVNIGVPALTASVQAEAKAYFKQEHSASHSYAVVVLYKTTQKCDVPESAVLSKEAKDYLVEGDKKTVDANLEVFHSLFGDKYISSIIYGNQLTIIFKIDKEESANTKDLLAKINANAMGQEAGIKLRYYKEQLSQIKSTDIFVKSIGDNSSSHPTSANEIGKSIEEHIKKPSNMVISHKITPYISITTDVKERAQLKRLAEIVESRITKTLERSRSLLALIENSELLDKKNLMKLNTNDPYKKSEESYGFYKNHKGQARIYQASLNTLIEKIVGDGEDEGNRQLPSAEDSAETNKMLDEISAWIKDPAVKTIAHKTLMCTIELAQGKRCKESIDLTKLDALLEKSSYLYFDTPGNEKIKVSVSGRKKNGRTFTSECDISNKNGLSTKEIRQCDSITIRLISPNRLTHPVPLQIHAASKTRSEYPRWGFFNQPRETVTALAANNDPLTIRPVKT